MYEISFGASQNSMSWIKSTNDLIIDHIRFGEVFDQEGSTRIFEIDWGSPTEIQVFEYGEFDVYLSYQKTDIEINFMMLSTGYGSEGDWEIWFL